MRPAVVANKPFCRNANLKARLSTNCSSPGFAVMYSNSNSNNNNNSNNSNSSVSAKSGCSWSGSSSGAVKFVSCTRGS
jgi:hypothetical protein